LYRWLPQSRGDSTPAGMALMGKPAHQGRARSWAAGSASRVKLASLAGCAALDSVAIHPEWGCQVWIRVGGGGLRPWVSPVGCS